MLPKVTIVTRIFQARKDAQSYDQEVFLEKAKSIENILLSSLVERVIVVTNIDPTSNFGEIINENGVAPTTHAMEKHFQNSEKMILLQCDNWGRNPGSARALTFGCQYALSLGANLIMPWSPELKVDAERLVLALDYMEERDLDIVGFLREKWFMKAQWHFCQNTGAIYRASFLQKNNFFSPVCDDSDRYIELSHVGKVPIAGMEDFHTLLRALKETTDVRWGMMCQQAPLPWNTHFAPGSERAILHNKKVARQEQVMFQYISDIFDVHSNAEKEFILERVFAGISME